MKNPQQLEIGFQVFNILRFTLIFDANSLYAIWFNKNGQPSPLVCEEQGCDWYEGVFLLPEYKVFEV